MIELINQNLLDAKVDVIIQSNNCFNTMGAGIAKSIREKYPEVYEADQKTLRGNRDKLGNIYPIKLNTNSQPFYCFLNYNQFRYGRDKRYVDYEAFYTCLEKTRDKCLELGLTNIGIPANMSCSNAGGSWSIIFAMIEEVFNDKDLRVLICKI